MIITLNNRLETTIKENEKLREQLDEIREILEQSNKTIEEYKNNNNDLR